MADSKYLKCACAHCQGPIEFPAEGIGESIPCPHCGALTELVLATPDEAPAPTSRHLKWFLIGGGILIVGTVAAIALLFLANHLARRTREQQQVRPRVEADARSKPGRVKKSLNADTATMQDFEFSSVAVGAAPGSTLVYASGTLKNATDRQRFGVAVELELQDATGAAAGTAKDYAAVIEPRAEWKFRALVVPKNVTRARITKITEQ